MQTLWMSISSSLKKTVQNGSMNSPDNYPGDYYLITDTTPAIYSFV